MSNDNYRENSDRHCYRVTGHYGGCWDHTVWMKTLAEAEQAYREIRQRNWSQLTIERTDGTKKAGPDSDWTEDTDDAAGTSVNSTSKEIDDDTRTQGR